jgi:two-component system cell cycle sensor histidine kinase/response regulator CckA
MWLDLYVRRKRAADEGMTAPSAPPPTQSSPQHHGVQVLIVEDERIVAGDLRARLRRMGYRVVGIASTGLDAIRAADEHHPDLVLMDIRLEGEMDGIQAADTIRQNHNIPIIYLSAYADQSTVERAKVTEPFGYLLKPFEDSELRTTIEMALYKRSMEQERRVLEAQLLQSQKMESIGTLVVGLAHNLNNILAIVMGYASRLERSPDDPAKVMQSVSAINQAVRRGAGLIQQLIGVTTKSNLQYSSVDINGMLEGLIRMVIEVFPKTITFEQRLDPFRPAISAEQNQLHQALLNILLNARDAMPNGGSITISSQTVSSASLRGRFPNLQETPYVRVAIADTGEGMDGETSRHIFEPFFTTRDRAMYTGLGLSVVYGIVSSHKGFIDVSSKVGEGTTLSLYFPSESPEHNVVMHETSATGPMKGGTETLLVVEDEEMLRSLVREVLTRAGYTVIFAVDGEVALNVYDAERSRIDLVLLDLGLPKLPGDEVIVKLLQRNPDLKVVFSTGYVRKEKSQELYQLGASGVVFKPYTVLDMLDTLRRVLDGSGPVPSAIPHE